MVINNLTIDSGGQDMTLQVMAAIDGSGYSAGVCDFAVWASQTLEAPLRFVHVVDKQPRTPELDLSGSIGLGAREHLLERLVQLDEERARIAQEQGWLMLEAALERAREVGAGELAIDQRNGTLVDVLGELQHDMRLLVIGMRGETAHQASNHLGSNLERVVRALYRPILVVPTVFKRPEKVMMAFDGSKTMCRAVELLAASPLVRNLPVHVVMVGAESKENRSQLDWAIQLLREAGHDSCGAILGGDVETSLRAYKEEQGIGLLVMGAYGHSRIRHLLVGSTTTEMLRQASVPVLLLR